MKTRIEWINEGMTPVMIPGENNCVRLRPPPGTVAPRGKMVNLASLYEENKLQKFVRGVTALDSIRLTNDTEARVNLASTLDRFEVLNGNMPHVITSSYRPPSYNVEVGGVRGSDHEKGLALDVAYGDYAATLNAMKALLAANAEKRYIRQLIFENVRGTARGYHLHIGFYTGDRSGEVKTLLWYSKLAPKLGYVKIATVNDLPGKERFEHVHA
jgi:hypothetical protein